MRPFIQVVYEKGIEYGDQKVLFDEEYYRDGITFSRLNELSGKIYGYLKTQGIGREDFVLLHMRRSARIPIAIYGVLRAGAAWVTAESEEAAGRVDLIRRDCDCKLEIDDELFMRIMDGPSFDGYEDTDDHDAAFAVYTSGTSGNPKGVLHEYGNLNEIVESYRQKPGGSDVFRPGTAMALCSPLQFVASAMTWFRTLYYPGQSMYVVPYRIGRDPHRLVRFLEEKEISAIYLPPSLLSEIKDHFPRCLDQILTGGELLQGGLGEGCALFNLYASSESGFIIAMHQVSPEDTDLPIGDNTIGKKIDLIREDGTLAGIGETGELCVAAPYTRGYLNLPEESRKTFRDGVYHTGDLAYRKENGDLVICGRRSSMIKIGGNRIEPAEVEHALKSCFGLPWVAVKAVEIDGHVRLAAYYTGDIVLERKRASAILARRLEYYMCPNFYIHVDEIPLGANGKLDRNALPNPDPGRYRKDYQAPQGELETRLCEAFSKVFHIADISAGDDFHELGGDSLQAISIAAVCGIPDLGVGQILAGGSPAVIARMYEQTLASRSSGEALLGMEYPLIAEQRYMLEFQLDYPETRVYELNGLYRFEKDALDVSRLAKALNDVIESHPSFLTGIHQNAEGEYVQRYHKDYLMPVRVCRIDEDDPMGYILKSDEPFKPLDHPLYRIQILETPKAGYLYLNIHHMIFDGTSMSIFFRDLERAYYGGTIESDRYYSWLYDRMKKTDGGTWEKWEKICRTTYDISGKTIYPSRSGFEEGNLAKQNIKRIPMTKSERRGLHLKYESSANHFFVTAFLLALAIDTGENDVLISWLYNGRDNLAKMEITGLLYRELPIAEKLKDERTLSELFSSVGEQLEIGISYSDHPYRQWGDVTGRDDCACITFQRDLYRNRRIGACELTNLLRETMVRELDVPLEMEIRNAEDGFESILNYRVNCFDAERMEAFHRCFAEVCVRLTGAGCGPDTTVGELRETLQLS